MNLLNLKELTESQMNDIFEITDQLKNNSYSKLLEGKTFVMFFPETSIRTRIAFEKGIKMLGGECILFPPETLDKRESLRDVVNYIENWADGVIVRHKEYDKLKEFAKWSTVPIINAMTAYNHPLEILSDIYSIRDIKDDYRELTYTFVGEGANIFRSWVHIGSVLSLKLNHVYKEQIQIKKEESRYKFNVDLDQVLPETDIVLTDALPKDSKTDNYIKKYQITIKRMQQAKPGALLNPCPPFYRGEEVSAEVINSDYFVGYKFKENLMYVKQAILLYCLGIDFG